MRTPEQTLHVQISEQMSVRLALDIAGLRVRAACGACTIQTIKGEFSQPTLAEWQKYLLLSVNSIYVWLASFMY